MKVARVALAMASLCLANIAWADIHTLAPAQRLNPPDERYPRFGEDVAIDGGFVIVLAHSDTGQAAYLYRRDLSTGTFAYKYTLLELATGPDATGDVAMKNGIAAIRMGNEIRIFEHSGANYVHTHSTAPLTHPGGIAISGSSVLVGGDGCTDDAVVYQKGADGKWGITSRLDDQQGACHPEGLQAALNNDYALLSARGEDHATAWHRDATGNWAPAGTLTLPAGAVAGDSPFALSNSTAVSPGNYVFRRSGTTWTQAGRFIPVNFDNTEHAGAYQVVDRDGVLVTAEPSTSGTPNYPEPYAYQETSPGHFEHVAMMNADSPTQHVDVSARTVVTASGATRYIVQVFYLPTPLIPPSPIVNDFETRDISGFSFNGGQFALAQRGTNDVLAQNGASGMAVAIADDSDWTYYQSIEADITPAYTNSGSWTGLVLRYVDANNFYYATVRRDQTYSVYKRVDGVDTLLQTAAWTQDPTPTLHVGFLIDGNGRMTVSINGAGFAGGTDTTFSHGRAGLATFQTKADFDDVHIAGTAPAIFGLFEDSIQVNGFAVDGKDFSTAGGRWVKQFSGTNYRGIAQQSLSGDALAYIGVPVENQNVFALAHLGSFSSSTTSGWFGLLARYQDSKNYYYAAVRSNHQIQIRKVVNGVITVLASAPFTPVAGRNYALNLRVINDELKLFVDYQLVLSAHDDSFTSGQYGLGTHSATATFGTVEVAQP